MTTTEIRAALDARDWPRLRALRQELGDAKIDGCTAETTSTLRLQMVVTALCRGDAGHDKLLAIMLAATDRGNHPYDDPEAVSFFEAQGAAAEKELDRIASGAASALGRRGGRKGGKSTSAAKSAASRANGAKGGRPRKPSAE